MAQQRTPEPLDPSITVRWAVAAAVAITGIGWFALLLFLLLSAAAWIGIVQLPTV